MYLWWPEVKGQVSSLDTPHCVSSCKVTLLNLEFTSRMGYLASEFEDSPVLSPSAPRLQKHVTTLLCGCCGPKLRSPSLWNKHFITKTTFQAPPSNILKRKTAYAWWVGWNALNIFGCLITWSQLVSIGEVLGGGPWSRSMTLGVSFEVSNAICYLQFVPCFLFEVWDASSQLLLQLPATSAQPSWTWTF